MAKFQPLLRKGTLEDRRFYRVAVKADALNIALALAEIHPFIVESANGPTVAAFDKLMKLVGVLESGRWPGTEPCPVIAHPSAIGPVVNSVGTLLDTVGVALRVMTL